MGYSRKRANYLSIDLSLALILAHFVISLATTPISDYTESVVELSNPSSLTKMLIEFAIKFLNSDRLRVISDHMQKSFILTININESSNDVLDIPKSHG